MPSSPTCACPTAPGLELLQRLDAAGRGEKAIVITAYGSAEDAVEALEVRRLRLPDQAGGPAPVPRGGGLGARAGPRRRRRKPAASDRAPRASHRGRRRGAGRGHGTALQRLVGRTESMQQVHQLVGKVARSMAPVLVHGESGTGKELVARAIHEVVDARRQALRRRQLRRHSRAVARGRVLRLPQGRLHRRRPKTARASSRRRKAARCSSTRSATCRWRCRASCCA